MLPALSSFYARCREQYGVLPVLRDATDRPPEHLLQAVWQHQRLHRDRLQTLDGRPVLVLHPGFPSREGGPDFRGAVLRVGEALPQEGDVEVDLRASGWQAHGHDRNPRFQNVILHVIWEAERSVIAASADQCRGGSGRPATHRACPPILPLKTALDAPLGELALWLGGESAPGWPEQFRGTCCAPLRELTPTRLSMLLHEAAAVRLRCKASQFQARARVVGWEQALWEGLFRALGYKYNAWPMLWLSERRTFWEDGRRDVLERQACLFGLSGLLPVELSRADLAADRYVRQIWNHWWRERERLAEEILPRSAWHLHGLRPANHPQRRLALAAHWSADGHLVERLEDWCIADTKPAVLADSLMRLLQVEHDGFWSWHWTLRSARLARPQPLLGKTRVTDLAINVVLPWLWMRAVEGRNERVRTSMEARYFAWPSAQDNAVLRLARQRLLGGAPARAFANAAAQQGLMQIVKDFCDRSNAVCEDCCFPEVVRDWKAVSAELTPSPL